MGRPSPSLQQIAWIASVAFSLVTCRHGPQAEAPFPSSYYLLELDTADECDTNVSNQFSQPVRVLQWAVELGQLHLYTEV